MYIFLINIIAFLMLVSCGGGISDIVEDIPNGYAYGDEAPQQKWIMFEDANSLEQQEKNYIPCKILKYKYNKKYIIAKIKFHYDMYCVVGFAESKQLKEGKIYYYIIDTIKNIRYGAFENYDKFNQKLKALNIDLKIDE